MKTQQNWWCLSVGLATWRRTLGAQNSFPCPDRPTDWEDVTDHQNFANGEAYSTLGAELAKVVSFKSVPLMSTNTRYPRLTVLGIVLSKPQPTPISLPMPM